MEFDQLLDELTCAGVARLDVLAELRGPRNSSLGAPLLRFLLDPGAKHSEPLLAAKTLQAQHSSVCAVSVAMAASISS